MQKYKIDKEVGYLDRDLNLTQSDLNYLLTHEMAKKLSLTKQKKYNATYLILETGFLFLELNDYNTRFNLLKKYLLLRQNMNFMNEQYLKDIDAIYKITSEKIYQTIVFYDGQIYDFNTILKKIVPTQEYKLKAENKNYVVWFQNKIVWRLIYNEGVYLLKRVKS